ncbi:hypothetical protein [Nocardioides bruguierae]|uniref:Uncharacterized protein n=1 Tax=Nocardioides bruguierae TaxID=2945102 RepID=A0A9X2DBG3_9ACTN|nr:hypothetical protein [Nocardioides bruguierae]MCL8027159.1 hypothetical protein [Nocardioides bruguierae]MCM0622307.1 hypothetical protein [Nocardioides bruguierae]
MSNHPSRPTTTGTVRNLLETDDETAARPSGAALALALGALSRGGR